MSEKDKDPNQDVNATAGTEEQDPAGEAAEAAANPDETGVDGETGELLRQIEELQAERDKYKDQAIRGVADLENLRRRVSREKDELRKYGTTDLLQDMLPVLDHLRLGIKSAEEHHPEAAQMLEGFKMVEEQFVAALKKNGLVEHNPVGEAFDPNLHEATGSIPSAEVGEGHVIQVMRPGFELNGRLIRPASVVVSSGQPEGGE